MTVRSRLKRPLRVLASLLAGALCGLLGHYLLYRLALPVEPFIYVAF